MPNFLDRSLRIAAVSAIGICSNVCFAEVGCSESLTALIVHSNGNVYFTTDKTCQGWCLLNYGTADANNKAYALVLTAFTTGKPIWFDWTTVTSCSSTNPANATPAWFSVAQ